MIRTGSDKVYGPSHPSVIFQLSPTGNMLGTVETRLGFYGRSPGLKEV
jgi:hypothetical protein